MPLLICELQGDGTDELATHAWFEASTNQIKNLLTHFHQLYKKHNKPTALNETDTMKFNLKVGNAPLRETDPDDQWFVADDLKNELFSDTNPEYTLYASKHGILFEIQENGQTCILPYTFADNLT